MVQVIACTDRGWVDRKTDYQQWTHACRAFGADLLLVNDLSELTESDLKGTIVVLEESGKTNLSEFEHPSNCTYIFGRSGLNNIQDKVVHDETVRICTPCPICLFGITAVGIVLNDRMRKNGGNNI